METKEEENDPLCIFCKKGITHEYPFLIKIKTIGTYYQHWNTWLSKGCEKNIENKSPDYTRVIKTTNDIQLIKVNK